MQAYENERGFLSGLKWYKNGAERRFLHHFKSRLRKKTTFILAQLLIGKLGYNYSSKTINIEWLGRE
jgi:hypothetical protein